MQLVAAADGEVAVRPQLVCTSLATWGGRLKDSAHQTAGEDFEEATSGPQLCCSRASGKNYGEKHVCLAKLYQP